MSPVVCKVAPQKTRFVINNKLVNIPKLKPKPTINVLKEDDPS